MRDRFSRTKSEKEIYKEEYEASKKGGETFFPETLIRDAIVGLLIVIAIIVLAILLPATSEPPADPTSTTYNPRPEWYFLFFFQFLKFFPGWLEPVAAAVIPLLALVMLALVPFLDRSLEQRWSQRKPIIGLGIVVILVLIVLGVTGAMSAPGLPAGEESLVVQSGRKVYNEINCGYCHSIGGAGGNIGPDLSNIGGQLDEEALATYLRNPHAMIPDTLHPKLLFTDEEMGSLVAYLLTLGAPISYSAEAPVLFEENCSSCHMINGKGGTLGPDLSKIGERRPVHFLEAFTADPKAVLSGTTMPAYKDVLTTEQIRDIAGYLASLRGEAPSPTPSPAEPQTPEQVPPAQQAPSGPPQVPHSLEGHSDCLVCHQTGVGGAAKIPADHNGRSNDICLSCHKSQ